jgi:hypothetical protein
MKKLIIIACVLAVIGIGCKKLTDIPAPQNQLTTDQVFADTLSATSAVISTYALFDKTIDPNYNKLLGLYTDELTYSGASSDFVGFNQSNLDPVNSTLSNIWRNFYFAIYSANQAVESLQRNGNSTTNKNLIAESKFLRGYAYFYLYNTFGQVPLLTTTDISQTAKAARADTAAVITQIINDLKYAQALPETYIGSGKVRANKWAATAMLAKADLAIHNWAEAEAQSTAVISSGLYTPLPAITAVFNAGSKECILQFFTQNGFIADGPSLIPASGAPTFSMSANLYNVFETGDLRKTNWTKSVTVASGGTSKIYNYLYKYHNRAANTAAPEYLMALRAGEQYLIRAEARVQQGNVTGAVADLNVLRQRAGLTNLSSTLSQNDCLNAVIRERRVEMFGEWGSRFIDLRRTGRINSVMSAYKTTWLPRAVLLPIPQSELTYDPSLTQNTGY